MSNLERRIERLEQATTRGRCDVCRDWAAFPVVHANPISGVTPEDAPVQPVCPGCGWQPSTITILYAPDWREQVMDPDRSRLAHEVLGEIASMVYLPDNGRGDR